MRNIIIGAIIGMAVGYSCGYNDGETGEPPVTTRVLNRFGVNKVKEAQESRERRTQDVIKP